MRFPDAERIRTAILAVKKKTPWSSAITFSDLEDVLAGLFPSQRALSWYRGGSAFLKANQVAAVPSQPSEAARKAAEKMVDGWYGGHEVSLGRASYRELVNEVLAFADQHAADAVREERERCARIVGRNISLNEHERAVNALLREIANSIRGIRSTPTAANEEHTK